jgi:hypothetical protein
MQRPAILQNTDHARHRKLPGQLLRALLAYESHQAQAKQGSARRALVALMKSLRERSPDHRNLVVDQLLAGGGGAQDPEVHVPSGLWGGCEGLE